MTSSATTAPASTSPSSRTAASSSPTHTSTRERHGPRGRQRRPARDRYRRHGRQSARHLPGHLPGCGPVQRQRHHLRRRQPVGGHGLGGRRCPGRRGHQQQLGRQRDHHQPQRARSPPRLDCTQLVQARDCRRGQRGGRMRRTERSRYEPCSRLQRHQRRQLRRQRHHHLGRRRHGLVFELRRPLVHLRRSGEAGDRGQRQLHHQHDRYVALDQRGQVRVRAMRPPWFPGRQYC